MNKTPTELGARIKAKREIRGISLRKLAAETGVSFATLSRLERGEGSPDHNTIVRLANWLGEDSDASGIQVESVALVHFRAGKNLECDTAGYLVEVAKLVQAQFAGEEF